MLNQERTIRIALPGLLALSVVGRYSVHYERASTLEQYFHGVYRPRLLGRELIVTTGHVTGSLLLGWMVVNGVAFMAFAWNFYGVTAARDPRLLPLYLIGVGAVVCSASTTTPYDFLSYALIVALVREVLSPTGRFVTIAALALAATCTRESVIIAVAAVVVAHGLRAPRVVITAVITFSTYLILHWTCRESSGLQFFQHVSLERNLSAKSVNQIALAALFVILGRLAVPGYARTRQLTQRRWLLWALSLPYLIVVGVGGIWTEAPRLVMPLVICEMLLAVTKGGHVWMSEDSSVPASSRSSMPSKRTSLIATR